MSDIQDNGFLRVAAHMPEALPHVADDKHVCMSSRADIRRTWVDL